MRFIVVTVVVATPLTDFDSTVSLCPLAVITETNARVLQQLAKSNRNYYRI
jgi:hypothetical protein